MPNENNHYAQAIHNENGASYVMNDYPDWTVTMCFYAALHYVETYALVKNENLERKYPTLKVPHQRRLRYIRDLAAQLGDKKLLKAYEDLQNGSQKARYLEEIRTDAYTYFARYKPSEVTSALDNLQIIKQRLAISL